jgi:4-amino-4-deoxy-L-arabinose transferase-like glycosyltransferase
VDNLRTGRLSALPMPGGDEVDYDCIAVQIWKRGQFDRAYTDSDYLAPYASQSNSAPYSTFVRDVSGRYNGKTTYRPPLLPMVMASSYAAFGRQFVVVRLVNTVAAAATCSLAAWLCRAFAGPIASFLTAGLMVWLDDLQYYGASNLTESLSAMFVGICLVLMCTGLPNRPRVIALLVGVMWGLAVLTRTSFVLWLPVLLVGVFVIVTGGAAATHASRGRRTARVLVGVFCFVAGMLAVVTPWWLRNCAVLGTLMPLGAQGLAELPAGFSDAAVQNQGAWFPEPGRHQAGRLPEGTGVHDKPLPEVERLQAEFGRKSAVEWVRANPEKLPALTLRKVWSEWKPASTAAAFVLFAAALGGAFVGRSAFGWACMTMVFGDVLMIAATWSVGGRFTFPVVAPLYALAGAGAWLLFRIVTDLREDLRRRTGVGLGQ